MTKLANLVAVERRFARSARIDSDLNGTPPLTGYVMQPSVRKALETMSSAIADSGQGAFTWTGPYGGGKSCAALLVGNLVAGRREQREMARQIAGADLVAQFETAFPGRKPWRVVALTGRRVELRSEIAAAAGAALAWDEATKLAASADDRTLCDLLVTAAEQHGGLLLILDELGKFFEHAAAQGGDVHLLQDLAERAARSKGRLILVGILHQSFSQYAGRASRTAKDEWAKIQGRFLDIPFAAGPDEVAALLARAISAPPPPPQTIAQAAALAGSVAERRPVDEQVLAQTLSLAWPLHPATAMLLGPVSRQRFAQNERSVFGFLTSAEPHGFQAYLTETDAADAGAGYTPDRLWDYLAANFGLELTAGADGPRVSLALEAIERAAVRGEAHARLTKIAALIELFRNGSGVTVSDPVLRLCAPDMDERDIEQVLKDLVERAVLIRQPRMGGYALFAGTDFDLEEALRHQRQPLSAVDFSGLPTELGVGPVAAKRHYFEKGALRTFDVVLQLLEVGADGVEGWAERSAKALARSKAKGIIVILMPDGETFSGPLDRPAKLLSRALNEAGTIAAVGAAKSIFLLREFVSEFYALGRVESAYPQLEGDRIARRELSARRSEALTAIRGEIQAALGECQWWTGDGRSKPLDGRALAFVASKVADLAYPDAPVLNSELLYRDRPSSSAMAAARGLAHAMVTRSGEANLGFEGFPAELGLYLTVIAPFGLHRQVSEGGWRFDDPVDDGVGATLRPAWGELQGADRMSLADLYALWAKPPYGLKRGVMPILALAYLVAHRDTAAVYVDGVYQSILDETFVDRLFQGPDRVEVRAIARTERDMAFLERLAEQLTTDGERIEAKALPVASSLFRRFRALPAWSQRTTTLSEIAVKVRDTILKADDPEGLLFEQLPEVLQGANDRVATIIGTLREAEAAYPAMLQRLRQTIAERLAADPETFDGLGIRAATVSGVTADLRFDAFAMRVGEFASAGGDIEGLASLLVHKPPRSWTDREHDQAHFELAKLARRFREAEALADLKGRAPTARAMSLMVGLDPNSAPMMRAFEVTESELLIAEGLADDIFKRLTKGAAGATVELAALARVFERLHESEPEMAE